MKYLEPLIELFVSEKDKDRAEQMERYMKGLFPFLGLDTKTRRALQKQFYSEHGYPAREELFTVVFYLWELPEREYQMCALSLLRKFQNNFEKQDIVHIEKLTQAKSWWDSVDGLSAWICGAYFNSYPDQIVPVTSKWVNSNNIWLQRSSLLFQFKYKEDTNTDLLAKYVEILKSGKDFFIRKAIGWILREYSKTNPEWVRDILKNIQLSPLSVREASKYI